MANFNISRLSEDVKREISVAMRDIKDSRISNGIVTVSHCELTNDLSYCKIYVSSLDGSESTDKAVECLTAASGFFKKRINQRIKMRKMPELVFLPDNSLDYYDHISEVIKNLPKPAAQDNDENGD